MFWKGPRRQKQGKNWMAPNSWKSASLLKVLRTVALALRDSLEFKTMLNSIGTGILEVVECPESVADQ